VFVAEAAALAFATSSLHFMQLDHVNFFYKWSAPGSLLKQHRSFWHSRLERCSIHPNHHFFLDRCFEGVQHFKNA
jgi:hypothetical protein